MTRRTNLILFFISIFASALSQNYIILQGTIVDKSTLKSIPYVHLQLDETNIGSTSNKEGNFLLKIPTDRQEFKVVFSHVGYQLFHISSQGLIKKDTIFLTPNTTVLKELTFKEKKAKEIVDTAFQLINRNYFSRKTVLQGYYIEQVKIQKKNAYISEGVIEILKQNYSKRHTSGIVTSLKQRDKKFKVLDSLDVRFYAGAHSAHRFDFVMSKEEFINPKYNNKYKYELIQRVDLGRSSCYEIKFTPKPSSDAEYIGSLFIDIKSYAFVGAKYKLSRIGVKKENSILNTKFSYKEREFSVDYARFDNKYYLKSIHQRGINHNEQIEYENFFSTTLFKNESYGFSKKNIIAFKDIYLNNSYTSDDSFWENNNYIPKTNELEQALLDEKDYQIKENGLLKLMNKINVFYGLSYIYTPGNASVSVAYVNDDFEINEEKEVKLSHQFAVQTFIRYNIKNYFELGWKHIEPIKKNGLRADMFAFSVEYRTGQFSLSPVLSFGHGRVRTVLGNYENNSSDLRVSGKNLKNANINASFIRQGIVFNPDIFITYNGSHLYKFYLSVGVLSFATNRYQLLLNESEGFFLARKKATTNFDYLQINYSNQDLNYYHFTLGLTF